MVSIAHPRQLSREYDPSEVYCAGWDAAWRRVYNAGTEPPVQLVQTTGSTVLASVLGEKEQDVTVYLEPGLQWDENSILPDGAVRACADAAIAAVCAGVDVVPYSQVERYAEANRALARG